MSITYRTIERIEGPILFLKYKHPVKNGEIVSIKAPNGQIKNGRVLKITEDYVCVEVFQGTEGLDTSNTEIKFLDELFTIGISKDMRGKTFDGQGRLIKDSRHKESSSLIPEVIHEISGSPINPFARAYPREVIQTGISVIDGLNTLVRGQKLPIFSGQGLSHNQLAAQIVKQAKVTTNEPFLIIFVGIGILQDDAMYFQEKFQESGNLQNVITFLNLASDPTIERILVPRIALTVAEYFAFELNTHVLVIITDVTNYCEALREISTAKGEIPGRKGFPGYMYSDLASIYERAGRIKGRKGSITQIPIITMPNDDITHPIPDLSGYITEGQIVLSKELHKKNIYPPVEILSSLSRLMKEGVGEERTREDHMDVSSQLYAFYSQSLEIRELETIVGEESLTPLDKKLLEYGNLFENYFIKQSYDEERTILNTLDLSWKLISTIPVKNILRISKKLIQKYYVPNVSIESIKRGFHNV
jgi:V/A-type H+-transporting ATPase subunit B